jgi:hypothetical protein
MYSILSAIHNRPETNIELFDIRDCPFGIITGGLWPTVSIIKNIPGKSNTERPDSRPFNISDRMLWANCEE